MAAPVIKLNSSAAKAREFHDVIREIQNAISKLELMKDQMISCTDPVGPIYTEIENVFGAPAGQGQTLRSQTNALVTDLKAAIDANPLPRRIVVV